MPQENKKTARFLLYSLLYAVGTFAAISLVLYVLQLPDGLKPGGPTLGYFIVGIGLPVSCVVFGISYFVIARRSLTERGKVTAILVLFVGGLGFWSLQTNDTRSYGILSEKEKQPLVLLEENQEKYLRHPYLGFKIPAPEGELIEMTQAMLAPLIQEVEARFGAGKIYRVAYMTQSKSLLIITIFGLSASKESLEYITDAAYRGAAKAFTKTEPPQILWDEQHKEATFRATGEPSLFYRLVALPLGPKKRLYLIEIQAITEVPNDLDAVIQGLRGE